MSEFVTIKVFSFQSELIIVRNLIESEGIETFLKDELTVQINPFYSNAVGGVKLQVKQKDSQRALEILKETGYLNNDDDTEKESNRLIKFWAVLNKLSEKIPLIKKIGYTSRPAFLIVFVALIVSVPVYFLCRPAPLSLYNKLIHKEWCLDYVNYDGTEYAPNSKGFKLIMSGFCNEKIVFLPNGEIEIPGFETRSFSGRWSLEGNILKVSHTDTFQYVFEGKYVVEMNKNALTLKSPKTSIYCFQTTN